MSLEELSMGNLLGFCDDGLSGPDFNTVPALGEDTSSSSLTGPPSSYYEKVLNNQVEIEGSIITRIERSINAMSLCDIYLKSLSFCIKVKLFPLKFSLHHSISSLHIKNVFPGK